ncbi:hypothetical protein [Nitratireductor rhodophyticola]|uniref:hypothetical protein n=1 Tax=Nitratireductor rhodophyticola TaxID=2854036 RepID=UPI0032D92722
MAWLRNKYECDKCGYGWEGEWSCACDDDCPQCGAQQIAAVDSQDLSVIVEETPDRNFSVSFSPASAQHSPDYIRIYPIHDKDRAAMLAQKAHSLCNPTVRGQRNGWLADVRDCVLDLEKSTFTLDEVYQYERQLSSLYPDNRFVREKIRQQLQMLRDLNLLSFVDSGRYCLLG